MKGYRNAIFVVTALFVGGCQSPASLGGSQPEGRPTELSVDSSAEPTGAGTDPTEATTTQPGRTTTARPTSKVPKVLGIPIDYQPSEIQGMEISEAEAYIYRQVSGLTLCAPAKCTIRLTRKYVKNPHPPAGEPPKKCAVDRGEWIGPRVSGGLFQLTVLTPCGSSTSTEKTTTKTTSSSPATKTS